MSVLEQLIAAAKPAPFETHGQRVHIRAITGLEREKWEQLCADARAAEKEGKPVSESAIYGWLVGYALSDERGNRVCTDEEAAQLGARLPAKMLLELFHKAIDVNRLSSEAVDAEKKDSAPSPTP